MFILLCVQHTPLEKLDKKHFAKGARTSEENGVAAPHKSSNLKEIALVEAKVEKLCDLLEEVCTSHFVVYLCSIEKEN